MNNLHDFREVTPEQLTWLQLQFDWSDPGIRARLALEGIALNILIKDTNVKVRQAVAFQHYGLDILAKDSNKMVRQTVVMLIKEQTYQKAKEITDDIFRQAGCL